MPPRRKPSAIPQGREVMDLAKIAIASIARNESSERKMVALCAKLKAAPVLEVS